MNELVPTVNTGVEKIKSLGVHTIEKDGVKITYEESYEELDAAQQEEMGIKGIRKKTIIEAPEDFWKKYRNNGGLYYELTEGSYRSFTSWTHAMWGDGGIDRGGYGKYEWKKYVDSGAHFQKIGGVTREGYTKTMYGESPHVFNLATLESSDGMWRDREDCPVFIFGPRNESFRLYINAILSNPEARRLLLEDNWVETPELHLSTVVDPAKEDPNTSYIKNSSKSGDDRNWPMLNLHEVYNLLTYDNKIWLDTLDPKKMKEGMKHLDILKHLIQGTPILYQNEELLIPVINLLDIKPLRWCHADVEMVKNDKGQLEIIFFET